MIIVTPTQTTTFYTQNSRSRSRTMAARRAAARARAYKVYAPAARDARGGTLVCVRPRGRICPLCLSLSRAVLLFIPQYPATYRPFICGVPRPIAMRSHPPVPRGDARTREPAAFVRIGEEHENRRGDHRHAPPRVGVGVPAHVYTAFFIRGRLALLLSKSRSIRLIMRPALKSYRKHAVISKK